MVVANLGDDAYQPLIYQPSQLGQGSQVTDTAIVPAKGAAGGFLSIGLPIPTRNRPTNTHGLRERILWPVLIAFGTIMAFAALYTVLLGLGAMLS